jgi:organic radical activating enzyme
MALLIMISPTVNSSVYGADLSKAIADHTNSAFTYEKRAAELDTVINEHLQMKKEYKKRFYIDEQTTPTPVLQEMEQHCDAIVRDANRLKSNFLALAEWHKLLASDLKQPLTTDKKNQSRER